MPSPRGARPAIAKRQCRFGDGPAVGLFALPGGCIVFSDQRQALCYHHAWKAREDGALAGIRLLEDLTADKSLTGAWNG